MKIEAMTPDITEAIPSEDIAIWRTKIHRVKWALQQQTMVTSEDGQAAWMLADSEPYQPANEPDYWLNPEHRVEQYESTVLYELGLAMSLNGLKAALDIPILKTIDPSKFPPEDLSMDGGPTTERAWYIEKQALLEGLGRIGIIRTDTAGLRTSPDAVVAALMYERADIKEATDRSLYARSKEINAKTLQLARSTAPRIVEMTFHDGEKARMPLYRALAFTTADGPVIGEDGFGLKAPTQLGKWWEELDNDFRRIETTDLSTT